MKMLIIHYFHVSFPLLYHHSTFVTWHALLSWTVYWSHNSL